MGQHNGSDPWGRRSIGCPAAGGGGSQDGFFAVPPGDFHRNGSAEYDQDADDRRRTACRSAAPAAKQLAERVNRRSRRLVVGGGCGTGDLPAGSQDQHADYRGAVGRRGGDRRRCGRRRP